MQTLHQYMQKTFGCKVYKISIDGGFTCPNRDGRLDTRGCIFCSGFGSGEFSQNRELSVTKQIEQGKALVAAKMKEGKYMAYFQPFTGTYAPVSRLRSLYEEALDHPDIVGISIATRPDCLPREVLSLLRELNQRKPVWVELGLQTIHARTASYIRRGYPLTVYEQAVKDLTDCGIEVITHVILGLPGESRQDMLQTVSYVGASPVKGIKLQLLHVLRGTDLEQEYKAGRFQCLTMEEYVSLVSECISLLPQDMVIHRMTGDGDRKTLIAPLWSLHKKAVLNAINQRITGQREGKKTKNAKT